MIRADHLTVYYGQHPALLAVSLELEASQVVGLLGQNGAGKTTLLKTLARLSEPGSGHVEHRGTCSFLPETPPIYEHLSVEEHLTYCAQIAALERAIIPQRVQRSLEWGKLEDHRSTPTRALSHGYRKRLGLAQCLLHDPDVLLLDEPLSGLDPTQVHHMKHLMGDLAKQGRAVVISSHMLGHVQQVCQRALILHQGRLVADERVHRAQDGRARLRVSVDAPASPPQVRQVLSDAGAQDIDIDEDAHGLRARFTLAPQGRAEISRALVEAGLGLTSMAACPTDLETLFLSLTSSPA